jgi:hypothetical protein
MSWFGNIVGQVNEAYKTPESIEKLKFIPRNETAFIPGDTIYYYYREVYRYGMINSVENGIVSYNEKLPNGDLRSKPQTISIGNNNLYHCTSWLKPVEISGAWQLPGNPKENYVVGYEKPNNLKLYNKNAPKDDANRFVQTEEGKLYIVVHLKKLGYKEYYDYSTGEYVGTVDVQAMNVSNTVLACKIGTTEPVKVKLGKYNTSQYGVIPTEFQNSATLKIGKDYAWNFEHIIGIGYVCPWLKDMKALWSEPGANKAIFCNPFEEQEFKDKMAELGL